MRLRKLRNKKLRTTSIRATIRHRNHARLMLEVIFFIINGITRTARSISIRVTALNHETRNHAMKKETVIKTGISKFNKIRNCIRSRLEVQIDNNFSFMSRDFSKNLGNTRIILVKNFSRGKSICGKAQSTANNELFKQNLSSVVISFLKNKLLNENIVFF